MGKTAKENQLQHNVVGGDNLTVLIKQTSQRHDGKTTPMSK